MLCCALVAGQLTHLPPCSLTPPSPHPRPRCKLFYKKESEFKEKGVGTLHLKLTEQKTTQMIVRADTSLGNATHSESGQHNTDTHWDRGNTHWTPEAAVVISSRSPCWPGW